MPRSDGGSASDINGLWRRFPAPGRFFPAKPASGDSQPRSAQLLRYCKGSFWILTNIQMRLDTETHLALGGDRGMKRIIGLLVGTVLLAGCQSPPPPRVLAAEAANPTCANVAEERARDAANNGYDEAFQQTIYKEAYQSCTTSKSQLFWIKSSAANHP